MKLNNLDRQISMLCPTCGCKDFTFDEHDENGLVICAQCERQLARADLVAENSELIAENQNEIAKEAQKQIEAEMKKMLKNAFKGNKNIKIR
ncbi:ECs_2282 family putative zinc-binding protein [Vibrio parahaemolyticus]